MRIYYFIDQRYFNSLIDIKINNIIIKEITRIVKIIKI